MPVRKLLIVEDERDLLVLYMHIFQAAGYQVEVASEGASALAALQHNTYDLILMDNMLPDMEGLTVLEKLCGNSPSKKCNVIMLSNMIHDTAEARSKKLGVTAYLIKSNYNPGELLEKVQEVMKLAPAA